MRAGRLFFLLSLLFLLFPAAQQACADDDIPPRPPVVLLLASGLSYHDLRPDGPLPNVRRLAEAGGIGLLNTAVSGEATEAAAYLSVGASERMAAPSASGPRFTEPGQPPRSSAQVAQQVYRANDEAARNLYRRRYGTPPAPGAALLHVGLPALLTVQPSPERAKQAGTLGDWLRGNSRRTGIIGDWRAVLVAMNREGIIAAPGAVLAPANGPEDVLRQLPDSNVLFVIAADAPAFDRIAGALLPIAGEGKAFVIAAVPAPPRDVSGMKWARLGFVAAAGPGIAPRSVLTSATTRTRGLVASVDLAPTIAGQELSGGAGRLLRSLPARTAWAEASLLDRQVNATTQATVPVLVGYAVFAIGSGFLALIALTKGRASFLIIARFLLLMAAAVLVAFLPVGILAPQPAGVYGLAVIGISALLAAVTVLLGSWFRVSPLAILLTGAALVICLDAFSGSPMVARALLSGYFLPGIRFYGIGNEYMGLLVGSALAGICLMPPPAPDNGGVRAGEETAQQAAPLLSGSPIIGGGGGILWLLTILVIGLPWWGADAGGALAATLTFVVAAIGIRKPRLRGRHILAGFACALAVVLCIAALDRLRPGEARSHVGAAVATGQTRGPEALLEIVARKVAMNVRIATNPATLIALAAYAPIWWLVSRGRFGERARRAIERRPLLARAMLPAALWGALAAMVFNDSGIVAAMLLLAPPTAAVIDSMLEDSLPISANS